MKLLLSGLLLCVAVFTPAKTFQLGTYAEITQVQPELAENVEKAFALAGHKVEWQLRPAERSLREAASGQLDGDVLRQTQAVENFPTLIAINVPILWVDYLVYINIEQSCPEHMADLVNLKPVGRIGFRYFDQVYAKSNVGYFQVSSIDAALLSLASKRADFLIVPKAVEAVIQQSIAKGTLTAEQNIKTCFNEPYFSLPLHTYLHVDHIEHLEELQKSYSQVFYAK